MKVGASLTISLMKDNKLWGLIRLPTHKTAKYVPYELAQGLRVPGTGESLQKFPPWRKKRTRPTG